MGTDSDPGRPLVSVILPVREPDPLVLARCLCAFAALPWARRLEIVLVHTGYFESGMQGLSRGVGAVRLVESTVAGIYPAFNTGIECANGRFLLFFGHDDIALPEMQNALELIDTLGPGQVIVACGIYVQGLGLRRPSRLRQGIVFRNWGHQALFYSAEIFRTRRYDPRYPLRADHRLNIALLADPEVRCERSPWVVSHFSSGGFSTANIADLHFDAEQARIASSEFGWFWGLALRALLPVVRRLRGLASRMPFRR
jgi:glycosyltransferase involved in cell wall biosynthesis